MSGRGLGTGRIAVLLVAAIVAAIDLTARTVSEVRLSHSSVELWWPTFNLADTFLIIGIIVIALLHLHAERRARNAIPPV